MSNTNWEKMVYEKDLNSAKSARRKVVDTLKIKTDDLPQYVDDGWEKSKEYKNPKYISVTRDKSIQEQFENKIWLLFVSMGFTNMNADSELYMPYDFHDESLVHQVDVLAVDDETVIMVECRATDEMTEISFAEEIKQFSDKISGLRKEILKKYPNRKSKFIWATHNYIIKKKDLLALEKAGIAYFNDSVVEYYSDLAKHLGSCSRYQLLGSLFANQEIKNMENRIPAIQGKMGGYTYYSFSIEPEKLLKIGYVLHRNEANQNMMPTYQRIIKKARLKSVRSFINDGGYFPNSIIISIDSGGKGLVFDQSSTKVDGSISKLGILHIPKRYRTAYIIDGQHRLYGYSDSKYARTNTIPVSLFDDRIEIVSPGGLPVGITAEEYLSGKLSVLRNRNLANVFYRLRLVEIFGTGIIRIKQLYAESLRKPDFEVSENAIKIVLPIFETNVNLTEDEKVIYKFLSKTMLKPISEIAPYVPFGKSKTTQLLKTMGEKGVVAVEGKGRGTKYIIK